MADHPFANAGLGNFGMEKAYSQAGIQAGVGNFGLGGFLAGKIGLDKQDKKDKAAPEKGVAGSVPPTQYEPKSNFPDIFQQQYVSPYTQGYGGNAGIPTPATSLQGFKQPNIFNVQPQAGVSEHHPVTNQLWGDKNG